jgi:hypothetical protein
MHAEQLSLFRDPREDPRIDQLINHLRRVGTWQTRRDLSRDLGWDDRTVRAIVEASEGAILSGQRGYKLTTLATREEFGASCGQLQSQIRQNTIRLRNQERVFHRGKSRFNHF